MTTPLDNVSRARLPLAALPALAGLRCLPGVTLRVDGDRAWLSWPAGDERVLRYVLPLAGAELYECRDGLWYLPRQHLPAFDVPDEDGGRPLDRVLFPAPVEAEPAPAPGLIPETLRIVRDSRPRPATALRCTLPDLARWAETATTAELSALTAARSGDRVLLVGRPLPPLPAGLRLWGEHLLVPLGFRPEPALPEATLIEALGVADDDLVVLGAEGAEVVPRAAFAPLTRAGVRLALRGNA
jgi:hypothetical protein